MRNILLKTNWLLLAFFVFPAIGYTQVNQQWVAKYNGLGNNFDDARGVAVDALGNVYVTGGSTGIGTGMDYTTIKYNAAGEQQWVATYNGPANDFDEVRSLAIDASGNVYITGQSVGIGTDYDYATIKYNTNGVQQWVARHNGSGNGFDEAESLALDGAGNVYITGRTLSSASQLDYATIKYNTNGVQQWVTLYNGPSNGSDEGRSIAVDKSGNVYVTGFSENTGSVADYLTIRYDANGNTQWTARYNGPGNGFDGPTSIAVHCGNVYVTGSSAGTGPGLDYATIMYSANGIEQWVARLDGPGTLSDEAAAVVVDDSGNAYVTGEISLANNESDFDYATVKYNTAGVQQWIATYDGTGNSFDFATSLDLDASANVYVAGISTGTEGSYDFATIKYNNDGVQQWVARYNGPAGVSGLVVDAQRNVYVTGSAYSDATGMDCTTIKYSQNTCGDKGDKVLICHKGQTICVPQSAVPGHINHGDQPGTCPVTLPAIANARNSQPSVADQLPASYRVTVIPNPATSITRLFYILPVHSRVSIQIYDMFGRKIKTLVDAEKQAGAHSAELNVTSLPKGIYCYLITVKSEKTVWSETGNIDVLVK